MNRYVFGRIASHAPSASQCCIMHIILGTCIHHCLVVAAARGVAVLLLLAVPALLLLGEAPAPVLLLGLTIALKLG
jgi:hypothetical protein